MSYDDEWLDPLLEEFNEAEARIHYEADSCEPWYREQEDWAMRDLEYYQ